MSVEQIAAAHARQQVLLGRATADQLGRLWQQVDLTRIAASWRSLLPRALLTMAAGQAGAAKSASSYVADVAHAYGVEAAPVRIDPLTLARAASDGRDMASLLYQPVVTSLRQIEGGQSPARGLNSGRFVLDMIARTQVADAGRSADAVAIAATPKLTGYVRMIVGKTCARCLILAGRRYAWNAGFRRHPRCDCRHVPVAENVRGDVRTDPKAYFDGLDRAGQDKLLGRAGAEAVRAGADLAKVVNARRGMQTADVFGKQTRITTEAAGRRVRLMPEQIFRDAKNRDDAVRLLRLHGYIL